MGQAENELVEEALQGRRFGRDRIRAECPFCASEGHQDKKTSLVVIAKTGRWFCYRCEEWGYLKEPPDPDLEHEGEEEEQERVIFEPPEGFTELGRGYGKTSIVFEDARDYLRDVRGITKYAIKKLRIGACDDGSWRGRVIAPHLDGDIWLGWVGRIWSKKVKSSILPYRYPKGMIRSLYNVRVLDTVTDEPALGVEGAFDAAHFPDDAFAFFGGHTPAHVEEIESRTKRPIAIVLDGDAWEKGQMLGLRLRFDGLRAGSVKLPPKVDPDEPGLREWILEEARRCVR